MTNARLALLAALVACTDPVREKQIRDLGDEDPDVPTGPDHRPGQPCLVCHSDGGPASDKAFVVAGTVFATGASNAAGAPDVIVRFVDSGGGAPNTEIRTSASGNFFVTSAEWPDLAFPVKVALFDKARNPLQVMQTTINREGSCNFCHDPFTEDSRRTIGPIYARTGAPP